MTARSASSAVSARTTLMPRASIAATVFLIVASSGIRLHRLGSTPASAIRLTALYSVTFAICWVTPVIRSPRARGAHPYIYPLALHRRATQDGTWAAREPLGTPGPIREVLYPGRTRYHGFQLRGASTETRWYRHSKGFRCGCKQRLNV